LQEATPVAGFQMAREPEGPPIGSRPLNVISLDDWKDEHTVTISACSGEQIDRSTDGSCNLPGREVALPTCLRRLGCAGLREIVEDIEGSPDAHNVVLPARELSDLRRRAPKTYARLRVWLKERGVRVSRG
jgi:hypothetical protein